MRVQIKSNEGKKKIDDFIKDKGRFKTAQSGWFPDNKYPDGMNVAQVAYNNEFGTSRIPARPFMRPAISKNKTKWQRIVDDLAKKVINDQLTFDQFLNQLILVVEGNIRDSIKAVTSPPLSELTVQIRLNKLKEGQSPSASLRKPLIDTAIMINSLTKVVE